MVDAYILFRAQFEKPQITFDGLNIYGWHEEVFHRLLSFSMKFEDLSKAWAQPNICDVKMNDSLVKMTQKLSL